MSATHGSGKLASWTITNLAGILEYAASAEELAGRSGLLQAVDPRVKVIGLVALLLAALASHRLLPIVAVFLFAVTLAVASRLHAMHLARRVWLPVLFFTGCIAFPAIFLAPQGWRSAAFLTLRAETAATLSALLVLTTPWTHVLKALRVLRAPVVFIVILGTTYRYLLLLLQTAQDMAESRQSRTVGRLAAADRRRIAAATIGVLMSKSLQLSGEVHMAMLSRGFRGEVYLLDDFATTRSDWFWLSVFIAAALAVFWMGR